MAYQLEGTITTLTETDATITTALQQNITWPVVALPPTAKVGDRVMLQLSLQSPPDDLAKNILNEILNSDGIPSQPTTK